MIYYSIATFKAKLSQILRQILKGEEVIVTDHNRPVAKVISVQRFPELPPFDRMKFLKLPLISLKQGTQDSTRLIRKLRDEG